MADAEFRKRVDGKYEQTLGDNWVAHYWEDPANGLWRAEVFHHDVPEFTSVDHDSLDQAAQAAHNFFDQT